MLSSAIIAITSRADNRAHCTGRAEEVGEGDARICASKGGVDVYFPDGKIGHITEITDPLFVVRVDGHLVSYIVEYDDYQYYLFRRDFEDSSESHLSLTGIFR